MLNEDVDGVVRVAFSVLSMKNEAGRTSTWNTSAGVLREDGREPLVVAVSGS